LTSHALSDSRRETLEHQIRARRVGEAISGYTLRLPVDSGVTWERELSRLEPEAAVHLLMCKWAPRGWAVSYLFEPGSVLVWQARHKPSMELGDYLTAIDPLELHEQMGLYPARRVTVEL